MEKINKHCIEYCLQVKLVLEMAARQTMNQIFDGGSENLSFSTSPQVIISDLVWRFGRPPHIEFLVE